MFGEALAYDSDGAPIWRSVVILAPRKNGKTALLAALSIYRLLTRAGPAGNPARGAPNRAAGQTSEAICSDRRSATMIVGM